MQYLHDTRANHLTLSDTLTHLSAADNVDGLALFGSLPDPSAYTLNPASDIDLLILVNNAPIQIFQMLTHIDGHTADIVFVETSTADALLEKREPVPMASFEGMFIQKMQTARIVHDKSDRLRRIQEYAQTRSADPLFLPTNESDLYAIWFWLNLGLHHLKRMSLNPDPVYQTAVDITLMGALSSIGRDYCRIRNIAWQGEKAAIRYWMTHDPDYLDLLRACISDGERAGKLTRYEQLIARTIEPIGALWKEGATAVYLRDKPHTTPNLDIALQFWEGLLQWR